MRRIITLTLCMAIAGCAHHQRQAHATFDEIDVAGSVFVDCVAAAEPVLDDRTSDANTVAHSLLTECQPQWNRLMTLRRQGLSPEAARDVSLTEDRVRRETVLKVVLEARAKRHTP